MKSFAVVVIGPLMVRNYGLSPAAALGVLASTLVQVYRPNRTSALPPKADIDLIGC